MFPDPTIGPHDVLLGKVHQRQTHAGNVRLRNIVRERFSEYKTATNLSATRNTIRSATEGVLRGVVQQVNYNGGRFLKLNPPTGSWVEVGCGQAMDKVRGEFISANRTVSGLVASPSRVHADAKSSTNKRSGCYSSSADVLFGSAKAQTQNEGNVRLKKIMVKRFLEYEAAPSKLEDGEDGKSKSDINKELVLAIKEGGGRFLRKNKSTGLWDEVNDKMAINKIVCIFSTLRAKFAQRGHTGRLKDASDTVHALEFQSGVVAPPTNESDVVGVHQTDDTISKKTGITTCHPNPWTRFHSAYSGRYDTVLKRSSKSPAKVNVGNPETSISTFVDVPTKGSFRPNPQTRGQEPGSALTLAGCRDSVSNSTPMQTSEHEWAKSDLWSRDKCEVVVDSAGSRHDKLREGNTLRLKVLGELVDEYHLSLVASADTITKGRSTEPILFDAVYRILSSGGKFVLLHGSSGLSNFVSSEKAVARMRMEFDKSAPRAYSALNNAESKAMKPIMGQSNFQTPSYSPRLCRVDSSQTLHLPMPSVTNLTLQYNAGNKREEKGLLVEPTSSDYLWGKRPLYDSHPGNSFVDKICIAPRMREYKASVKCRKEKIQAEVVREAYARQVRFLVDTQRGWLECSFDDACRRVGGLLQMEQNQPRQELTSVIRGESPITLVSPVADVAVHLGEFSLPESFASLSIKAPGSTPSCNEHPSKSGNSSAKPGGRSSTAQEKRQRTDSVASSVKPGTKLTKKTLSGTSKRQGRCCPLPKDPSRAGSLKGACISSRSSLLSSMKQRSKNTDSCPSHAKSGEMFASVGSESLCSVQSKHATRREPLCRITGKPRQVIFRTMTSADSESLSEADGGDFHHLNGMSSLLDRMKGGLDDIALLTRSIGEVLHLIWEDRGIPADTGAGYIRVVAEAVSRHNRHPQLAGYGCSALAWLATAFETSQATLREIDANQIVITLMRKFPSSELVQENGCRALCAFASDIGSDNVRDIVKSGGIQLVIAAMKEHSMHEQVEENGCMALAIFAKVDPAARLTITRDGGLEAVIEAISKHKTSGSVRRKGCFALSYLVRGNCFIQDAARRIGCASLVRDVKRRGPQDLALQGFAGIVLDSLSGRDAHNETSLTTRMISSDDNVFFGQSMLTVNSTGNRRFHAIIAEEVNTYETCNGDDTDRLSALITRIVERTQERGGRFLEFSKESNGWVEISSTEVRGKVHGQLRFKEQILGSADCQTFKTTPPDDYNLFLRHMQKSASGNAEGKSMTRRSDCGSRECRNGVACHKKALSISSSSNLSILSLGSMKSFDLTVVR